jgi:hypothetical protein
VIQLSWWFHRGAFLPLYQKRRCGIPNLEQKYEPGITAVEERAANIHRVHHWENFIVTGKALFSPPELFKLVYSHVYPIISNWVTCVLTVMNKMDERFDKVLFSFL